MKFPPPPSHQRKKNCSDGLSCCFSMATILQALMRVNDYLIFRVDDKGMICAQRGIFRVNCVDCLDRTNVVQTAIARIVLETQVLAYFVLKMLLLFYI